MAPVAKSKTADDLLDAAEWLVQTRGWNGFSYADLASRLGIRKASIHYHFAAKTDLGLALITRYRKRLGQILEAVAKKEQADAASKLERYIALYESLLGDEPRMCLCGMLAADFESISPAMRQELSLFFDDNEAWLTSVLSLGRRQGELEFRGAPRIHAQAWIALLEGGLLLARLDGNGRRFSELARRMLEGQRRGPQKKSSK